jgi:hypothetical protein
MTSPQAGEDCHFCGSVYRKVYRWGSTPYLRCYHDKRCPHRYLNQAYEQNV